ICEPPIFVRELRFVIKSEGMIVFISRERVLIGSGADAEQNVVIRHDRYWGKIPARNHCRYVEKVLTILNAVLLYFGNLRRQEPVTIFIVTQLCRDLERDIGVRILSTIFFDLCDSLLPPIGIGSVNEVGGLGWGCREPMLLRRCEPKRCPHRYAADGTYDNKQQITSDSSLHQNSRIPR